MADDTTYSEYAEDDAFSTYMSDNRTSLEMSFFDTITPPVLDDDMPDYLDDHYDEFTEYCREQFGL